MQKVNLNTSEGVQMGEVSDVLVDGQNIYLSEFAANKVHVLRFAGAMP